MSCDVVSLGVASHVLWCAGNAVGPMLMVLPCCGSDWPREDPMAECIESCCVVFVTNFSVTIPIVQIFFFQFFHFKTGKCFRVSNSSLFISL